MIREELVEAAKGLEKYALRSTEGLTYLYVVDDKMIKALEDFDMDGMKSNILFVFGIKDMMYMDAVWAQKGYGPAAYKVAMQTSPSGWLGPYWDSARVTKSAQKVWKEFFDGKGSKDVEKKLIYKGADENNYRSYLYKLKNKMNLSKNIRIDKDFVGKDQFGERRTMLDELANGLLVNEMNKIY